jgi:hypothetical protein
MKRLPVLALLAFGVVNLLGASGGCGPEPAVQCGSNAYACGPGDGPAGGPKCCGDGSSCCFGHGTCCKDGFQHLGKRRSDGATMCYQNLNGEGSTWDLLTVCGKPG